jgi:regulator of RNase E activity RraA
MATRMKMRGAVGAVVSGRIRDMKELRSIEDFAVWAKGTSTVGTGAEAIPWCRDVPLEIGKVVVTPVSPSLCTQTPSRFYR